jgi:DNA-binding MarR family transcriptional regulator
MEQQLTDEIVANLVAVMPIFHRKLISILDDSDAPRLKHYQFTILGMLSSRDALPVSEFSHRLLISRPQMTAILDNLVEQGLISRTVDETDRRIVRISITSKGRRVFSQAVEHIRTGIAQKLAHLDKKDLDLFAVSLRHIAEIGAKLE